MTVDLHGGNESEGSRGYWTDPLTWSCNLGIFVFGIVMAVLGAILPSLFESVRMNPAEAGSLFLFLNLGFLMMTVMGGPSFDRFGYRSILIGCSFLVGLAFLLLAWATEYADLRLSCFVLGLGGGGLNVGTNALVADLYPDQQSVALNRLGVFFGLGTLFIPLVIGVLLETLGLRLILIGTAAIGLLPGVSYTLLVFPLAKQASGFPVGEAISLLRNPYLLLVGVLLFFQSGNEMTTGGWLSTFLVERLALQPASASLLLSAFWASLVVGRLVATWVLGRMRQETLVQLGALGAAACLLGLVALPGSYLSSLLLVCLAGLSLSVIFPTVMGQASSRFPGLSGTVLGLLMAIALVGGMLLPWSAGLLVFSFGIDAALLLPAAGFLAVFLVQSVVRYRYRQVDRATDRSLGIPAGPRAGKPGPGR